MSHFTVAVVVGESDNAQDRLGQLMAPYDEGKDVEPYVVWNREIAAATLEKDLADYRKIVAEQDATKHNLEFCATRLAELESTDAEEFYQGRLGDYEDDLLRDGEGYSTYNPLSEWDWWVIGGRWDGAVLPQNRGKVSTYLNGLRSGSRNATFAFVSSDGKWHEKGDMHSFGVVADEKEQETWNGELIALLEKENPNAYVYILDAHI